MLCASLNSGACGCLSQSVSGGLCLFGGSRLGLGSAGQDQTSSVSTRALVSRVRCTGHRSAISSSLWRCSLSSGAVERDAAAEDGRSSHPRWDRASWACTLSWRTSTRTCSSGQPLRRAYMRMVIDVQAAETGRDEADRASCRDRCRHRPSARRQACGGGDRTCTSCRKPSGSASETRTTPSGAPIGGGGAAEVEVASGPGGDHRRLHIRRRADRVIRWSASSRVTKLLGCFAAMKIRAAFEMSTVSSRGACITSSAMLQMRDDAVELRALRCPRTKLSVMVTGRPAERRPRPCHPRSILSSASPKIMGDVAQDQKARRCRRLPGRRDVGRGLAASPRRRANGRSGASAPCRATPAASAAARRSSTLEVKVVLANSPCEWPRPVKSKRSTAMPMAASRAEMRRAGGMSLEQVKQWAKRAVARCGPSGMSRRADSRSPA